MAPSKMTMLYVCLLAATLAAVQGQLLSGLVQVGGVVTCSVNSSAATSGLLPFPNAKVALVCNGTTVTTVNTLNDGSFTIYLNLANFPVSTLLTQCNVTVLTPLANCNAELPSTGELVSSLTILANIVLSQLLNLKVGLLGLTLTP